MLSPEAMRELLRYPWPGNVRELENALEYAIAVSQAQTIHPQDLPLEVTALEPLSRTGSTQGTRTPAPMGASAEAHDSEYKRIRATLDQHQWHRAEAAKALGMSRTTLWRKMREFGLLR